MNFVQVFCGGFAVITGMLILVPMILTPETTGISTTHALELTGSAIGLFVFGSLFGKAVRVLRTIEVRRRRNLPSLKSLMF